MTTRIETALVEIEAVLPRVKWTLVDTHKIIRFEHADAPVFFEGIADEWRFVVATFDIERQGFPPGPRGYDGAARRPGLVARLPRELAKIAADAALRETST